MKKRATRKKCHKEKIKWRRCCRCCSPASPSTPAATATDADAALNDDGEMQKSLGLQFLFNKNLT